MSVRLYWRNTGVAPDYDLSTDIGTAATVAITTSNSDAWQLASTNWSVALADPPTDTSFPTSVVIAARGNGVIRIRVSRANSGGTILASSAWGNELASVGTHTQVFTLATTWAAGDRLVIQVEERRAPNTHGGSTVDVGVNREATHVDYTAGPPEVLGAATLAATAQLTVGSVVIRPPRATLAATASLNALPNRRSTLTDTYPGISLDMRDAPPGLLAFWEGVGRSIIDVGHGHYGDLVASIECEEGVYYALVNSGHNNTFSDGNLDLVLHKRDGGFELLYVGVLTASSQADNTLPQMSGPGMAFGRIGSKLYMGYAYLDPTQPEYSRGGYRVDTYDLDTQVFANHGSVTGLDSTAWPGMDLVDRIFTAYTPRGCGVVIGQAMYTLALLSVGGTDANEVGNERPYWFFEVTPSGVTLRASFDSANAFIDTGTHNRPWKFLGDYAFAHNGAPYFVLCDGALGSEVIVLALNTATWAATKAGTTGLMGAGTAPRGFGHITTASGKCALMWSHGTFQRLYDFQPAAVPALEGRWSNLGIVATDTNRCGFVTLSPNEWNGLTEAVFFTQYQACYAFDYDVVDGVPSVGHLDIVMLMNTAMFNRLPMAQSWQRCPRGLHLPDAPGFFTSAFVDVPSWGDLLLIEFAVQHAPRTVKLAIPLASQEWREP